MITQYAQGLTEVDREYLEKYKEIAKMKELHRFVHDYPGLVLEELKILEEKSVVGMRKKDGKTLVFLQD
jgi:hypothetical protein